MAKTPQLNAAQPIVGQNGTMEQPFRTWANTVTANLPVIGSGSPEGVVDAPQFAVYIDSTGVSGALQYIKLQPDIAGDTTMGWVAV